MSPALHVRENTRTVIMKEVIDDLVLFVLFLLTLAAVIVALWAGLRWLRVGG